MNLHTNLPFEHRPAPGACGREQSRGGGAGAEAEPSGASRADWNSRQAPATSQPAAGHPDSPPRRRPGARKPRKSELRPEALRLVPPRWLPAAWCSWSVPTALHGSRAPRDPRGPQGKSPCARSLPGQHWSRADRLAPARGDASRDRHRDALRGHTQAPRLWLLSRPRPRLARPPSDSQRKPPPVTPRSHRSTRGCVG